MFGQSRPGRATATPEWPDIRATAWEVVSRDTPCRCPLWSKPEQIHYEKGTVTQSRLYNTAKPSPA